MTRSELPSRVGAAWRPPLVQWLEWLRAGGISPNTIETRIYHVALLATSVGGRGPFQLTAEDLGEWMAARPRARETLRSMRATLRSFYGWAHSSGLVEADPARLLRRVPAAQPRPRPASDDVVADALAHADDRQYLMIMLGARHGLRRAEIAQVHSRDVLRDVDGWALVVHGKGDKERVVPLLDDVSCALRECGDGWVFPNGKGSHITPAHVGVLLRRVLPTGVTAHQLRHRFASQAYHRTHDIRAVQELLGHASVATTQRYTATSGATLRAAVQAADALVGRPRPYLGAVGA